MCKHGRIFQRHSSCNLPSITLHLGLFYTSSPAFSFSVDILDRSPCLKVIVDFWSSLGGKYIRLLDKIHSQAFYKVSMADWFKDDCSNPGSPLGFLFVCFFILFFALMLFDIMSLHRFSCRCENKSLWLLPSRARGIMGPTGQDYMGKGDKEKCFLTVIGIYTSFLFNIYCKKLPPCTDILAQGSFWVGWDPREWWPG